MQFSLFKQKLILKYWTGSSLTLVYVFDDPANQPTWMLLQSKLKKKKNPFMNRPENQKLCRACIVHLIYAGIKRTKAAHQSVLSQMFYLLCSSIHVG
jgi:hypothetical protein